ncbi:uncharacterized protein EAE97_000941 [Botrytis byssoidea]|uniref:nitrilase n=1 Tax=Botrytis byssoidea TaxID=139641 RepID=A0A9P5M601_9HELO|nr:uncharacterized protein EAE97_000941 [Botrytis byssoidea]KAF7953542.1 hypothetical protein EAE97_000941 [Botrytis byssoidea]
MGHLKGITKVVVTQAEPEWLDLEKAVEKTCRLIVEAATNGAKLITFPECWIPGYPAWIWSRLIDFELSTIYIKNSLKIKSSQMAQICAYAAKYNIIVSLGFSENDNNSLYISQAIIRNDGEITMARRKLKPTHMERTVFGDASGNCLKNVAEVPGIGRIGLWSMSKEGTHNLSQTYAIESQTFVLHTTAVLTQNGIDRMDTSAGALMNTPGGGSSAIFGPDGRKLSVDIPDAEEGIIYADLDLDDILKYKAFIDVGGHYSRPDMLWLGVNDREKKHSRIQEE